MEVRPSPLVSSGQAGGTVVGSVNSPHPFLLGLRRPLWTIPFKCRAARRQAWNSQAGTLHCPQEKTLLLPPLAVLVLGGREHHVCNYSFGTWTQGSVSLTSFADGFGFTIPI